MNANCRISPVHGTGTIQIKNFYLALKTKGFNTKFDNFPIVYPLFFRQKDQNLLQSTQKKDEA
jgi:hypothetical protein